MLCLPLALSLGVVQSVLVLNAHFSPSTQWERWNVLEVDARIIRVLVSFVISCCFEVNQLAQRKGTVGYSL